MKRPLALLLLASMLAACGTPAPRPPEWRGVANAALADYIKQRLEGHAPAAARAYTLAQERMRDGGDLDGLHTVLLTRCAMDVALLLATDCNEFVQRNASARAEALAYHALLTGTLTQQQLAMLPERYRALGTAWLNNGPMAQAAIAISDPLSRLIASGIAARADRADDTLFAAVSDAARAQGWRAAHRAHESARIRLLDAQGRTAAAAALRARLQALYGTTAP